MWEGNQTEIKRSETRSRKEYKRQWYQNNKEQLQNKHREYRHHHAEENRKHALDYYHENKDRINAKRKLGLGTHETLAYTEVRPCKITSAIEAVAKSEERSRSSVIRQYLKEGLINHYPELMEDIS